MNHDPGKVVHWDALMFLAIFLSATSTSVNIFAANLISSNISLLDSAIIIVIISISLILINYALESISNYREIETDVRLRRILSLSNNVKSSVINVDINIAIGVIHFYALAPGIILSLLIYITFLSYKAVNILYVFSCTSLILYYPIKLYISWRGKKIQTIRKLRNRLLDEYAGDSEGYGLMLDRYAYDYRVYWRIDVCVGCAFVLLVVLSIIAVYIFSPNDSNKIAILTVYLLFISQLRSLILYISVFQENRKSALAIETQIQKIIARQL